MMKLSFTTANDAFDLKDMQLYAESGRILRRAAELVEAGMNHVPLFDSNGNHIGSFKLTKD